MPVCEARGCSNRTGRKSKKQLAVEAIKKITFHEFPKDGTKRKLWLNAIGRIDWLPGIKSVLCSEHFEEHYFDRTSPFRTRLLVNAIPSIYEKPHSRTKNIENIETTLSEPSISTKAMEIFITHSLIETREDANISETIKNLEDFIPKSCIVKKTLTASSQTLNISTLFSPLSSQTEPTSSFKHTTLKQLKVIKVKYRKILRRMQQKYRRQLKRIATLRNIIELLEKQKFTNDGNVDVKNKTKELINNAKETNKEMCLRTGKCKGTF